MTPCLFFNIQSWQRSPGFELNVSQNAIHYCDAKEFSFYYFRGTKLCWDHVCNVNEWCLVDCFHCKLRVSTQVMVHNYLIAKCKKFSACGVLLIALWVFYFAIQNIYVNLNSRYLTPYFMKNPLYA